MKLYNVTDSTTIFADFYTEEEAISFIGNNIGRWYDTNNFPYIEKQERK